MNKAPWILFTITLLAIIYLITCNKPAPTNMVPRSQYKAMEQRLNDTAQAYAAFRAASDSALDNATASAIQANEQANKSRDAMNESKQTIQWLLSQLDSADKLHPDSSWVQVSPLYKESCDSLRKENLTLNYRITQHEQDNQMQVDALGYEIHLRDSILDRERGFNTMFSQSLADCIAIGKQQQKDNAPRNQIYAGFGVMGSQFNPLAGGEVNLSLKTKSDQIYEVRGALIMYTWYVGAGTKFKLHF